MIRRPPRSTRTDTLFPYTTLFRSAITGELDADKGSLSLPKDLAIAVVAQETPSLPDLAIEFVLDGDIELRSLEARLTKAEDAHDVETISNIHERLNAIRSEDHTSELQSLMRISYAIFCLTQKIK